MKHSISLHIAPAIICICPYSFGLSQETGKLYPDHIEHEALEAFQSIENNYEYRFRTEKWEDYDPSTIK